MQNFSTKINWTFDTRNLREIEAILDSGGPRWTVYKEKNGLKPRETFEPLYHRRRIKTDEKAKVVAAVWGTELIQNLAELAIPLGWFEGWLEKWLLGKMDALKKIVDYPVNTRPNLHPTQMDVLPKLLFNLSLLLNG